MKTTLRALALLVVGVIPTEAADPSHSSHGERVLQVTGGTWDSNLTAISTGSGLVVVDTLDTPEATAAARSLAQRHFQEPGFRFLVNTHAHDDHVWGNELFSGIPIVSHERTRLYMVSRLQELAPFFAGERVRELESQVDKARAAAHPVDKKLRDQLESAKTAFSKWGRVNVTPPTLTVEGDASLHVGAIRIDLVSIGLAHSEGDLVVSLPSEDILIVGDLVGRPGALMRLDGAQGNVVRWLAALDRLVATYSGPDTTVIPGHGASGSVELLDGMRAYLAYVVAEVRRARELGWSLEDARKRLDLPRLRSFDGYSDLRANNIEAAWESLDRLPGTVEDG